MLEESDVEPSFIILDPQPVLASWPTTEGTITNDETLATSVRPRGSEQQNFTDVILTTSITTSLLLNKD